MKKIFASIFAFLGISLLFTGCELWKDIWNALSPIDKIYLYTLDANRRETQTLSIYEDGWGEVIYEISYSSESDYSCDVEVYSDNEEVATVEWSSATVSDEGTIKVYGISKGECTVTMKAKDYENEYASVKVIVNEKPLKFKTKSIQLDKGNPDKKTATLEFTNTTGNNVTLSSSNTYYATVAKSGTNKALVTAVRTGTATITVKTNNWSDTNSWSDTCTVTIVDSSNSSITITNGYNIPSDFYPGKEFTLEAAVNVGTGISKDITWASDNKDIVSVDANTGKIKALKEGSTKIYAYLSDNKNIYDCIEVNVSAIPTPANQFFWGKWTRMDKGTTYIVEETYVLFAGTNYKIKSSDDNTLVVETLGTFTKDSENVIKWHDEQYDVDIPFYRQGGTNLKYKVRVVGFEDVISGNSSINVSRAAGSGLESTGKKNLKVKGQSERYSTYTDEGTTDENGEVELTAPVQGDTQTLTIKDDDGEITVVSGLKVENDGDFMGTIPLVKKTEYSLKVTGKIEDSDKTNGYLYANNYKKYPLTLTISNFSEIKSQTSTASISCADPNVSVKIVNSDYTLDSITISGMKAGATKTIQLEVSYGNLTSTYKDVALDVRVENLDTHRVWVDYVPLRFFAGDMPISIAGKATERDPNTALNGFVIYPDGNSKFFTVTENNSKTFYVPVFGSGHKYKMVFSGATVTGNLSESTEMYYTVAFDSKNPVDVDLSAIEVAYTFGENYNGVNNNSETTAFDINNYFAEKGITDKKDFEAYLYEGDIDFYLFETDSASTTVHNE